MVSDRPAQRLNDVLDNIARIRSHIRDMDEPAFLVDIKTIDAVERCFERIAEAMRKIGGRYDEVYPDLALQGLRDFGSVLRHDYESIEPSRLWVFATEELHRLEAMARAELVKLPPEE
ncbi:MAG: DUF86 domain-containing protein [Rhodospirillales bacterium]